MIKKLIGIIVATAVIVIIVIAAIRRDNFQSMVLRDEIEDQTYPEPVASQQPATPVPVETETTDSRSVEVIDSLREAGSFVGRGPETGVLQIEKRTAALWAAVRLHESATVRTNLSPYRAVFEAFLRLIYRIRQSRFVRSLRTILRLH